MNNKKNLIEPKTLQGFMELLPDRQILFNRIMGEIKAAYESFGFLPLDTPALEYASVLFAKAGGETEKQIYRFTKGETDMALRFDLTVPLAKYVAKNYHNLAFPFRRYQIGKVYRGERPQKGRFREFYQCDIDIVGDGKLDILCDAEIPGIISTVFRRLGFTQFKIFISNRKILQGLAEHLGIAEKFSQVCVIADKLKKIGEVKVREELEKLEISKTIIDQLIVFLSYATTESKKATEILAFLQGYTIVNETFVAGVSDLISVVNGMKSFGVSEDNFAIDLTIVRGLDYYTGTVFETFLTGHEDIGSVCSGGRYDNLAGYYIDKPLPGVGISIGLTRLFDKLADQITLSNKAHTDVLVVSADSDTVCCLNVAAQLRQNGLSAIAYLEDAKLKNKFKYAERLNIKHMIILGETERANHTVTLKDLQSGQQYQQISIDKATQTIKVLNVD